MRFDPLARAIRVSTRKFRLRQHPDEAVGKGGRIPGRTQPGFLIVTHHFGNTVDVRGENRNFHSHGFEDHTRKRFLVTGADKQIRRAQKIIGAGRFGDDAEIRSGQTLHEVDHRFVERSISSTHHPKITMSGKFRLSPPKQVHRPGKDVLSLAFADRAEVDHQFPIGTDFQGGAKLIARVHATMGVERAEIDPSGIEVEIGVGCERFVIPGGVAPVLKDTRVARPKLSSTKGTIASEAVP